MSQIKMQQYQCHKMVHAFEVGEIKQNRIFGKNSTGYLDVPDDFFERNPLCNPSNEGYLVRYEDGYISWSPKDVFERGYSRGHYALLDISGEGRVLFATQKVDYDNAVDIDIKQGLEHRDKDSLLRFTVLRVSLEQAHDLVKKLKQAIK